MKREIKYRGKRVDNHQWVEGYFFKHWDKCYIAWGTINDKPVLTEVVPETVGQYIGYEYFEGDIVKFRGDDDEYQISEVGCKGRIVGDFGDWNVWLIQWAIDADYIFEKIGNIHDNPELLENASL